MESAERLRHWRLEQGFTQGELGNRLGMTQSAISDLENGRRKISTGFLQRLCKHFNLEEDYFFQTVQEEDVEMVPLMEARPYCGMGGEETSGRIQGSHPFRSDFLARKGQPKRMRLFRLVGDSMSPTLLEGDMVMVDLSQRHVASGRIYMIRIGPELAMKRLEHRPGGVLLIKSDNRNYSDIVINTREEAEDVEVLGRMVWSCREY